MTEKTVFSQQQRMQTHPVDAQPVPVQAEDMFQAPFTHYQLSAAYDEMFAAPNQPHSHYTQLYERFHELSMEELERRQLAAERSFLHQGITFTVYNDNRGTERIFPYDLLPRIIPGNEWETIERGLTQRITAINMFLHDIYPLVSGNKSGEKGEVEERQIFYQPEFKIEK